MISSLISSCTRSLIAYYNHSQLNALATISATTPFYQNIKTELQGLNHSPHLLYHRSAQAVVWSKLQTVFVSFKGTSTPEDCYDDSKVIPTPWDNSGLVHRGFLQEFESLQPLLTRYLKEQSSVKEVIFAGHSMGGALAQLGATYYGKLYHQSNIPNITITCHTFGCPRTGDAQFVKTFQNHTFQNVRVANQADLITLVPELPLWQHTLPSLVLNGSGHYSIQTQSSGQEFASSVLLTLAYVTKLKDHKLETYLTRLIDLQQNGHQLNHIAATKTRFMSEEKSCEITSK